MPRAASPSGRKPLVLFILAALLIGNVWWWSQPQPPPEPVYAGQSLAQLLADPAFANSDQLTRPEILHRYGPTAVAWLAWQAEHGRHPFTRHGSLPFDRAPDWLRRWLPERWGGLRHTGIGDERQLAIMALLSLGPEAAPATPALAGRLEDNALANIAAWALNSIGPASWPVVHEALEHGSIRTRINLLESMEPRFVGKEQRTAEVLLVVADFVKALEDPNPTVRAQAAWTIAQCRGFQRDPALFDSTIPTLIQHLDDPNQDVRQMAIGSIGSFGAKGAPAIPRLIALLDDPNATLRNYAAISLAQVDRAEKRSAVRLRAMLHDPNPLCRGSAAEALKALDAPLVNFK